MTLALPDQHPNWHAETSGDLSAISPFPDSLCMAGAKATGGSIFARWRLHFEENGLLPWVSCWMKLDVTIPPEFAEDRVASLRLAGTDNYSMADGDEFRFALYINADGSLGVLANHQNHDRVELWRGGKIQPGRQVFELFGGAQGGLIVRDGNVLGQWTTPLFPPSVPSAQRGITRIYCGIDGASSQAGQAIHVIVHGFEASENIPVVEPPAEGCAPKALRRLWNINS